ncbi:MAG TPA: DUF1622 domain-containing protein [Steroidobacteraceae bacterium]|nr:DUF1622 domain-containing protein [Steroidobacteraceae bacterium]
MKEWLDTISEHCIVFIDAVALAVIVFGTLEVVIGAVRAAIRGASSHELRIIWLKYARWLTAALTFQLAADIIETSITTDWQTIGRVAAIAVIRTFLNFFLDRDLEEIRVRQHSSPPPAEGRR